MSSTLMVSNIPVGGMKMKRYHLTPMILGQACTYTACAALLTGGPAVYVSLAFAFAGTFMLISLWCIARAHAEYLAELLSKNEKEKIL